MQALFENILTFQLTPSQRATCSLKKRKVVFDVSTHALTEGDCLRLDFATYLVHVSTHALTEGDYPRRCGSAFKNVSTHALTEGDN